MIGIAAAQPSLRLVASQPLGFGGTCSPFRGEVSFFFVKRFGGLVLIDDGCTLYMGLFVGYGRLWVDMDWDWRVDGWIIICFIVDVFDLHSYLVLIFVVLTDLEEEVKPHW